MEGPPAFDELPLVYRARIRDIQQEFMDGEITKKGYDKRLAKIMQEYQSNGHSQAPSSAMHPPSIYLKSPSNQVRHADAMDENVYSSYSPVSGVSRSSSIAGGGNNPGRARNDGRKSTVLGFRKPGINFDALLDDYEDDSDGADYTHQPQRQQTPGSFRQPVIGNRASPFQLSSPPKSKAPDASLTSYGIDGRDGDEFDGQVNSGRALHVLKDIMDPYGAQSSQDGQDLYSDGGSSDGMLDDLSDLGPNEFNPEIIAESSLSGSRIGFGTSPFSTGVSDAVPGEGESDRDDVSETSSVEVKRMNSLVYPRNGKGRGGRSSRKDDLRRQISRQQSLQYPPMPPSPMLAIHSPEMANVKSYTIGSNTADVSSTSNDNQGHAGVPHNAGIYAGNNTQSSIAQQLASSGHSEATGSQQMDSIETALRSRALLARQTASKGETGRTQQDASPAANTAMPTEASASGSRTKTPPKAEDPPEAHVAIYGASTGAGATADANGRGSTTPEDLATATSSSQAQSEHLSAKENDMKQPFGLSGQYAARSASEPNEGHSGVHTRAEKSSSPHAGRTYEAPTGLSIDTHTDCDLQHMLGSLQINSEHASAVTSPTRMQRSSIQSAAFGNLEIVAGGGHAAQLMHDGAEAGQQPLISTQAMAEIDSQEFEFPAYGEPITRSGQIDDSDNDHLSDHESFGNLPLGSESHPQPQPQPKPQPQPQLQTQLSATNRVLRRPTHSARSDRRPANAAAGGAGRASYYAPESELEVPANFDMPPLVPGVGSTAAPPLSANDEDHSVTSATAATVAAAALGAGLTLGVVAEYNNSRMEGNGFDVEADNYDPRMADAGHPVEHFDEGHGHSRGASIPVLNAAPIEGGSVRVPGLIPGAMSAPKLDGATASAQIPNGEYGGQEYGAWQTSVNDTDMHQPFKLSDIGAIVYPREVPSDGYSSQLAQLMSSHQSLPSILRYRASATPNEIAYTCIDTKGKEIGSWTWAALHARAIQTVQLLRQNGVTMWGDRVALVYRKYEVLEFVGSLFGCLYAGLCAVPIVAGDSYAELVHVLNSTSAVLVLTTELNIKSLNKDLNQSNVGPGWPTDVAWVRTDNLGGCTLSAIGAQSPSNQYHSRHAADSYSSSKADASIDDISADDIAYIEFSKSPNGELKGVQVTHGAIMTQCVGWMMSTGMLGVGRKYTHRVELEQDEPTSATYYSHDVVDPNNELGPGIPASTPGAALGTPEPPAPVKYSSTASPSPVAEHEEQSSHQHGSFSKKWGSSSGFLGRLRNVGSLPRLRRGSRAKDHPAVAGDSPRMSTSSIRDSTVSQATADGRMRAMSSTSAAQYMQHAQQAGDGSPLASPQGMQKNPTRLSAASKAAAAANSGTVAGGSLDAGNDLSARSQGTPAPGAAAAKDVVVFYIEPRQHFGLVYGILGGCYGGHQSIYTSSALCDIPGAYINLLTRYRATVAVGDYTGLQSVLSAATDEPSQITDYNKKIPPNLASLRLCLVDTLFIDPVFHTTFNRNVLHPFGCPYQSIADVEGHPVMTAVCTLAEHGSVLMSMRDCLSSHTPANADRGSDSKTGYEFVLDRDAFKENRVVVLPDERNEAEVDRIGTVRYQSFGFPALGASITVVDPETRELCAPDSIGELWIDSPSLGSGFWGLPKLTSSIFAARFTYSVEQNVELVSSTTYLRTGLMGALVQGRVLVFGFYEDRIRTLTIEPSPDIPQDTPAWYIEPTLGFHYAGDINSTIRRYLPQITECTAFEMFANETHFPVIAAEVRHNSGMYSTIAEEIYGVLRNRHGLYAYAVVLCPQNTLPRAFQYGKRTVNAQLCRHQFESGKVDCLYVKVSTDNLFLNLPPPASALPEDQFADAEDPSIALYGRWLQQTSLEEGMPSIDERSGIDLCKFGSITEIMAWRATKYPEEVAYSQFDERGRAVKSLTFQKLLIKVSAVAQLMLDKRRVAAGDHVLVVMTPSPSFVVAIHACLAIGAIPVPVSPPDVNRLSEDMPPLLATVREFKIDYMLVSPHSDEIFRSKMMEGAMRSQALRSLLGSQKMPGLIAVAKASKSPKHILGRGSFKFNKQWSDPTHTAMVMQFTGAQASTPQYVSYTHRAILGFCAQQKGDFQMLHSLPVIASVRAYSGYGLLHCSMIGVYVGCMTLLLSPVDFFSSPNVWFELVQKHKIKDAFTTLPMLQHAMNFLSARGGQLGFSLQSVRNFILATEERVDPVTYSGIRDFFARARLDDMAINPLYGTLMNPCISTRAYLGVDPLTLRLDTYAMRRRKVVALPPLADADNPEEAALHSLTLQDSGKVSGSTMVAIVDPATRQALPAGSIGEVWVCSSSNALKKQTLSPGMANGSGSAKGGRPVMAVANSTGYLDGNKDNEFVRTGDLGFLYLQVGEDDQDGAPAEPYLFVAGKVTDTFSVDEYLYFFSDIERTVEESSSDFVVGGCVIFQTTIQPSYASSSGIGGNGGAAGNFDASSGNGNGNNRRRSDALPPPNEYSRLRLVAVISVRRAPSDSFLPNATCLVFNSVLDRHQVLLDEIVFVPRDSLPRSRISERRRRTVRGLYESSKLNVFVGYTISNSPTLSSGAANPNSRQSFIGPPTRLSSSPGFPTSSNGSSHA
ncbi:hypothetical protein GGI12_000527 [Dipsacomyces acuminosporus]|nr:hypothetical protein GGI12_000527 [Dipsacomyces acuminosporus]